MTLHTDVPTRAQVDKLLAAREESSVLIYVPTDPVGSGDEGRIQLKTLAAKASGELEQSGADRSHVASFDEAVADLLDDDDFWRFQARSLAVFATPTSWTTFRLANRLEAMVEVADRFHLKPLLRAVTFPQAAFVLVLGQGSVRLLEVSPELEPEEVSIPDLPSDVAGAAGKASIKDRSPSGRLQGSEGQKVRMRQYVRKIDQALRPFLNGVDLPLILAATEPLDSIYRARNSYPHLAPTGIAGNPERTSDAELADSARAVLDELYAGELRRLQELYDTRSRERRASADIADVARAATFGMVDTVLVDMDEVVPGSVDEETGAVEFDEAGDAVNYGVVDEIARRVWLNGGRVLAVRRDEVPGRGSVAAILRYAP